MRTVFATCRSGCLIPLTVVGEKNHLRCATHKGGQQLSCLSRAEEDLFKFTRENSLRTIGIGTTIAIKSRLSYASTQTGAIA